MHDTGGTYNEYTWDGGSDGWLKDVALGDVPIPGARAGSAATVSVDSTGQAFIAFDFAGVVTLEYSTNPQRSTWSSITLSDTGPLEAFNRTSLIPFTDSIVGPQMGILYFNSDNVLTFRRHDDDVGDIKADWISENLDTLSAADDHVCLRSNSRTGALYAVVRTNPGAVEYYQRPDRGSWSGPTTIASGSLVATRPQLAVDEDNDAIYVFWTDLVEERILYRRADAGSTNFDPAVPALAYPGLDSFRDVQLPKSGLTRETGLMVLADAVDATWYAPLPIPDMTFEFADSSLVEWRGGAGFDAWNLYRGKLAVLRQSGFYTQQPGSNSLAARFCGLSTPAVADNDPILPGEVAFYLVTGVLASFEEELGDDGDGVERPNHNPCP
jgi:hypothetical protein